MRALLASGCAGNSVSSRLIALLRTTVDPQGPVVMPLDSLERPLAHTPTDLLLIVLSPDPERGLLALRTARRQFTGHVLAVGQVSDSRLILRALHEGADHYLDEGDLETGLDAALSRLQSKEGASAPAGRLVCVLAASGGSGASTLAVNVAAVLARDHSRCALIDLKPGRGDLAALLDLRPAFNLADVCLNASRLDRAMFEKVLVEHPSGIHLLAAPQVFGSTRLVTTQGVSEALALVRRLFPHTVVDLEDCFHEEQLVALRQAASILLVTRLDFTSLRNVRRILEHLAEVDIPRTRVRLIANRHGQPCELPTDEAEDALGGKLSHLVPDDPRTINGANNTGIPAVLKSPSTKVSQALAQLARAALDRRRPDTMHANQAALR